MRLLVVLGTVFSAALADAATAAPLPTRPTCQLGSGEVSAARGALVVVTFRDSLSPSGTSVAPDKSGYYACYRPTGRKTRFEPTRGGDEYLRQLRVAGRFVSYMVGSSQECSTCPPGSVQVKSYNARTRLNRNIGPTGLHGATLVGSIVSDTDGRLAWIASDYARDEGSPAPLADVFVRKFDRAGRGQLADGLGIRADSLELRQGLLTWTQDNVTRSRLLR